MRLKPLFFLCTGTIAVVIAVFALRTTWFELQAYKASLRGERGVGLVAAALAAMEKVSLERAPSNALIGSLQTDRSGLLASLAQARSESDLTINRLKSQLPTEPDDRYRLISRHLAAMSRQLQVGRADVDTLASRAPGQRQPESIRAAVRNMIGVVAELEPAVIGLVSEAERVDPGLSDPLTLAYLASELREQAGQLGSEITASVATRRPLDGDEIEVLDRSLGRIEALRDLLRQRLQRYLGDPQVARASQRLEVEYFQGGLAFVDQTIDSGKLSGDYAMTTAGFAARYVPSMASILSLRDLFLSTALDQARGRRADALESLVAIAFGYALLLAVLAIMLLYLGRRVMQAFAATTRIVVAIADGKLDTPVPATARRDEIGEMLRGVQILKEGMIRRNEMEAALKLSEQANAFLAAIVESSDDAIIGKTLEGIVTTWNSGAEKLYGYTGAEAAGKSMSFLVPAGHADDTRMILDRIIRGKQVDHYETVRKRKDEVLVYVSLTVSPIKDASGRIVGASAIARDITGRKRAEEEREKLIAELQDALAKVKTLSGLIPICASCKKIRDDRGYWNQIESYIGEHSEAEFSHGICPECAQRLYPEIWDESFDEPDTKH